MRKYKRVTGNGLAHSEEKDMMLLSEHAANGWEFYGLSCLGRYKFRRAEKAEWIFSVDYKKLKKGSAECEEYLEVFAGSDWEHVYSYDYIHYFRAPVGTPPIYNSNPDALEKQEVMLKNTIITVLVSAIIGPLLLGFGFFFDFPINLHPDVEFAIRLISGAIGGGAAGVAIVMAWSMIKNSRKIERMKVEGDAPYEKERVEINRTYLEKKRQSALRKLCIFIVIFLAGSIFFGLRLLFDEAFTPLTTGPLSFIFGGLAGGAIGGGAWGILNYTLETMRYSKFLKKE